MTALHPMEMLPGAHVFRVVWIPGTDLLLGHCWCGHSREAEDPIELWDWLTGHPATHGGGPGGAPVDDPAAPPRAGAGPDRPSGRAENSPTTAHEEHELDLLVTSHRPVANGVVQLILAYSDGARLPDWTPGAHLDLVLGPDLVRQYSLCGKPGERTEYRIAVLLEPESRGGSSYVHEELADGATVHVRGPRNHFELEPSPRYLFIAGGIGVTPLVPMVAKAVTDGADVRFEYGGRSRGSMAYLAELQAAHPERLTVHPQDEVGLLDLDGLLGTPQPDTLIYTCGPEPLLQAVEARCADWPAGALHLERFSPKELGDPVRADSFEVELRLTGQTLTVPPEKSVLECVEEAGVAVLSSCTEGTCGTCETTVLAGEVDHRDSLLSADEQAANDTMFICVSRARSDLLVLEL